MKHNVDNSKGILESSINFVPVVTADQSQVLYHMLECSSSFKYHVLKLYFGNKYFIKLRKFLY